MIRVSFYEGVRDTKSSRVIDFVDYLEDVRSLKYQDLLIPIWNEKNKDRRATLKKRLPLITTSGQFKERKDGSLIEHSGIIAIDFDDVRIDEVKPLFSDPYTLALHRSCSHTGYVCYVKINGKKHAESFEQLAQYYYNKYNLYADPSGRNLSRARFVSGDPDLYYNEESIKFAPKVEPKDKAKPKDNTAYICTADDIDELINRICEKGIDVTSDYLDWLRIGFALCDHYGHTEGYTQFDRISQFSEKYDPEKLGTKMGEYCAKSHPWENYRSNTFLHCQTEWHNRTVRAH